MCASCGEICRHPERKGPEKITSNAGQSVEFGRYEPIPTILLQPTGEPLRLKKYFYTSQKHFQLNILEEIF